MLIIFLDGQIGESGSVTGKGIIDIGNFINDKKGESDAIFTVRFTAMSEEKGFHGAGFFDSDSYAFTSDKDFTYVGFGTSTNAPGHASNFEFTQVPEPGTVWLVALGLISAVMARTDSKRCSRCA